MTAIVARLKKAFTLPELLVVILVLGMLAGIAVPTYRDYVLRAKMLESVSVLHKLLEDVKDEYLSSHTIPGTLSGVATGTTAAFAGDPCISFIHYDDGSTWANAGKAVLVQGFVAPACARGIQGYIAGSSGAHNRISTAFLVEGEDLKTFCGSWENDGTEVPLEYLPEGCKDDEFMTQVTG